MKIVGSASPEKRTCLQSVKDAVVSFDRLVCFWDRAVFNKEKPLELPTVVGCDGITLEEQEQTGLDWESDEERSEETSLKCLVDSLSRDLEDLKKERYRLRDMELEAESVMTNLRSGLRGKGEPDQVLVLKEDVESLHRRIKENGALAEKKVADATAELEHLRRSESEALAKLEIARRELQDVKSAKEGAVKRAKLAETAKAAMAEELRECFLKEREKPVLVHASAWAAEAENCPGDRHRWPQGGKWMPSMGNVLEKGQR